MEDFDVRELKAAAFETLMFFPGCDLDTWIQILLKEYTEEVVAVLGTDPEEVTAELREWWTDMVYTDEITEISRTYTQWAQVFSSQKGVDFYRTLVEEAVKAKEQNER